MWIKTKGVNEMVNALSSVVKGPIHYIRSEASVPHSPMLLLLPPTARQREPFIRSCHVVIQCGLMGSDQPANHSVACLVV